MTKVSVVVCCRAFSIRISHAQTLPLLLLLAALLMGNVVIMKIPQIGGLSHLLTSKFQYPVDFYSSMNRVLASNVSNERLPFNGFTIIIQWRRLPRHCLQELLILCQEADEQRCHLSWHQEQLMAWRSLVAPLLQMI